RLAARPEDPEIVVLLDQGHDVAPGRNVERRPGRPAGAQVLDLPDHFPAFGFEENHARAERLGVERPTVAAAGLEPAGDPRSVVRPRHLREPPRFDSEVEL